MAFLSDPNFTTITGRANEPFNLTFQDCTAAGVPLPIEGKEYALTIYGGELTPFRLKAGILTGGSPKAYWDISGVVTEGLRGKSGLKLEVAEVGNDGREVIQICDFIVLDSSPGALDNDARPNAKYYLNIQRWNDPATIDAPMFKRAITSWSLISGATAPVNSVAPSISGSAQVGSTLTANVGTWTGSPTFTYQWSASGVTISGATASTYTVQTADTGKTITVTVTAIATGSTSATSAATAAVTAAATPAPVFTTAPTISPANGTVGTVFTATNGSASNASSYAGQWLLDGAIISGATALTYTSAATGALTYRSTATGAGGSTVANTSAATVTAAVTLGVLTLSTPLQINAATTGSISGATSGSTLVSNVSGLTVNSSARTYTWSGSGEAGTTANGIVETLSGATNSPNNTSVTVTAAAFVAPTFATADYIEDFETPVGPVALLPRANWIAGDANTGNLSVRDGYAYNAVQYGPTTTALFGPDIGDFRATFNYSTVNGNGNNYEDARQYFVLWYKDSSNYLTVEFSKGSKRLYIKGFQGGTALPDPYWANANILDKGEMTFVCRGGKIRCRLDGVWLPIVANIYSYPFDIIDVSGRVTAANRLGKVGFAVGVYRYPIIDKIEVTALNYTIDFVDAFVGRDSLTATGGKTQITGTLPSGASPSSWLTRVLDASTNAVVVDWTAMINPVVNGTSMTGMVFLPTGGPYVVHAGYVESSDGKFRGSHSMPCLSGIRGIVYGQSNAVNRGGFASGVAAAIPTASTVWPTAVAGTPGALWSTTYNKLDVSCSYEIARVMATALNKPVGVDTSGSPGTGLDSLAGGASWEAFKTAQANKRGVIEFCLWDQGENDADGAFPPTNYAATFRNTFLPNLRTFTGNPNIKVFISPVGRYAFAISNQAQIDSQREVLRQQYLTIVANEPNVIIGDSKLGTAHLDGYHYVNTAQGYPEMARRAGYTIAKAFGANIADGRGAQITSASRSGALIDLTIDLNGGSGLTGPTTLSTNTNANTTTPTPTFQGMYGFQVSADNFASTLAISDVALVSGKLRITLAADPAAAVKVRSHYGASFDDSVTFGTTYADGRASIPMGPILSPITAS